MSQLGRISGQLLKDNLTRNGHDLTFDDDLLHLDVTNRRIGIKTVTPQYELDVGGPDGTIRTTNLEVTNQSDLGDLTILGNTITSNTGTLNLTNGTGNQVTYQTKLVVDNIDINNNIISTNATDVNLELRPNGTGSVEINANTNVYGNIYASGNIRADGNITVGDANTDNITINADVNSDIIPDADGTYKLGEGGTTYEWDADFALGDVTLTVSGSGTSVVLSIPAAGPTWVDALTDDLAGTEYEIQLDGELTLNSITTTAAWTGTNPQTVITTNDAIPDGTYNVTSINFGMKRWADVWAQNIYSNNVVSGGITVDSIDLTLRPGKIYFVSTNGSDSVTVSGTHQNDPFLTVKHALSLAVSGDTVFIYPGTYLETFPLTIPVGVTVKGHSVRSVFIEPTIATIDLDAFLLNGEVTVEDLTIGNFRYNSTNNTGYAFRLATNFLVTTRSPYIRNVSVISRGSATSGSDPYGFDSNDAGKGVLADGSIANALSKEVSLLFTNATFFTPNQECITATNGVRIEWLNSFTYFADKGFNLLSGTTGFAGAGLTRLRIDSRVGTWAVGNTVSYYDTDGVTVLGTGTIASVDGNYVNLTGRQLGFQTITDRLSKTVYAHGNAKLSTAQKKFGTASLALDGTGDYATVATQPDFLLGTGNWTIELWVYKTGTTGGIQQLIDFRATAPTIAPTLYLTAVGTPTFNVNAVNVITAGSAVANNIWTHIAVSKSGTSTKMFINGTQTGSTYTDNNNYIQGPLTIGARYDGAQGALGYIDDVRISKGVARYTTTFTPSTTALTGDLSTVLLLHFNGTNNSTTFLDNGITLQDLRTSNGGTSSKINFADYSDFGVEVRSIGSANVYGNYGVYGDGDGVIAYLISQNFSYIGSGKVSTNDPNDAIHANEIVKLNRAKIYYTTVNNEGTFNVGDLFYVNQKTGDVTFDGSSVNITAAAGVSFTDGVHTTTITPTNIDTGNIRISGNTIESLTGDVIVTSASGAINLQNNTFITGDLDVTGDITLGGNITIGDQSTDTVSFVAAITSNLIPATTAFYDLGTDLLRWQTAYLNRAEIDGVVIDSNTISTTIGNDNLTLSANGSGKVLIPSNNVQIDQALTVNGTTTLKGTTVNGSITQTGDVTQTGDFTLTGNADITGNLTVSSFAQFEKIKIDLNTIATTTTNTDLILEADGAGKIYIPTNDVLINQNLTVNGIATFNNIDASTITADSYSTGDILIENNSISTTLTDSNLQLSADGVGKILIPSNNVQIDQALTVNGTTTLKGTTVNGDITQTGNVTQTGDFTQIGNTEITGTLTVSSFAQFEKIKIDLNTIATSVTDTDLILEADGTGKISIPTNDVLINQNLTVNGTTTLADLSATSVTADSFSTGDILIENNSISTTLTDSDLTLSANGTGIVSIPSNDVQIDQALTVNGTTTLKGTTVNGDITQIGNVTQTGDFTQIGNTDITGNLTVSSFAQFEKIRIDSNTIAATATDTDLILEADGAGKISIPSNDVLINQNLTVNGLVSVNNLDVTGNITANSFTTDDILIQDNYITTTVVGSSLELIANGVGIISIPNNDVQIDQALTIAGNLTVTTGTTYLKDTSITGTITQTGGDIDQTGNFTTSGLTEVTGNITATGYLEMSDITISGNLVEVTTTDTDLDLRPNGTGDVIFENIRVVDNTFASTGTNQDIILQPQGIGSVIVNSTQSLIIPVGTDAQRPATPTNGMIRYNTDRNAYEGWNATYSLWLQLGGVTDYDGNTKITAELTPGANDNIIRFYANGTLTATIDSSKLYAERFQTSGVDINGNTISALSANTDLNLTTSGTGSIKVGNLSIKNNTITNTVSGAITEFTETGTGYVKITGTNGFVIPSGDLTQLPSVREVGMMRFNTYYQYVEVFDGVTWVNASGSASGVSLSQAQDIGIVSALLFG
jgi:hypothetical protein